MSLDADDEFSDFKVIIVNLADIIIIDFRF